MDRDILKLFDYERKRRPALAALADNVANMSADEIANADVPMPWMRQALLRLKGNDEVKILRDLIESTVIDGINPDPEGVMCQWKGDDTYIKVGRTALLVTPGTLLWIDRKGMWIDTIYTTEIDPKVRPNVVAQGKVTRSAYNIAVRDKARKSAPADAPTIMAPANVNPAMQSVRFFTPG